VPPGAFDYGAAHEHLTAACGRLVAFDDGDAFVDAACDLVARPGRNARSAARAAVAGLDPRSVTANFVAALAGLSISGAHAGEATGIDSRGAASGRAGESGDTQLMRSPS
jgi:hypothetical protein